jgi:hypothetical protein
MKKQLYICNGRHKCGEKGCVHYSRHVSQTDCESGGWSECVSLYAISNHWKVRCVKVNPCK